MSIIITKKLSGGIAGSGVFSQSEKLALELEMSFKAANLTNYKELIYTDGTNNLSLIIIYEDNTKSITLFTKAFIYNETTSLLERIIITRIFDNATLTKNLTYDENNNLISILSN